MERMHPMGRGRFSSTDWDIFSSATTTGRSTREIFTAATLQDNLNPARARNLTREARDSASNPHSTPLIVGLDVTGSMHRIPDYMVRDGLPVLFKTIYDRKPVPDPQIMFAGIGDVVYDRAPLQVSQFEADISIAQQLKGLYLEGGGGANASESYPLVWYFAGMHTSTDSFEKRRKKGYLFTIGDEMAPDSITADQIQKVMGIRPQQDFLTSELLDLASQAWNVFHITIEEGSNYRRMPNRVRANWTDLLGQRALFLSDYRKLSELIVSTIQILEGESAEMVAGSWAGETAQVIRESTRGLSSNDGRRKWSPHF
ncbi:hypothetical protein KBX73_02220 [Acetobacter persici]|uniref:hypothetical protein n=1 Tax=Acetobacter persici TaxID=1076596 RepID=UPI0020CCF99D|nr:hypothetical protein [Acetobacter persici]MCP9318605.1 hypothetical protein [Acetobacter persici]